MLIPHPLHRRVVEPTLLEWTLVEPQCAEPHRWLGDYEHLKLAIELDPGDQLVRKKLVIRILRRTGTYELPDKYVGCPDADLALLNEAEALLQGLRSDEDRKHLSASMEEERALIREYLDKQ